MRIPKYRLQKSTGRALVEINGKRIYLGKHGTKESRAAYDRILDQLRAKEPPIAVSKRVLIKELVLAYWEQHVTTYYLKAAPLGDPADRRPTPEQGIIKSALRYLRLRFGEESAHVFDVLKLEEVRNDLVAAGLARKTCNRYVDKIRHLFKWAGKRKLIDAAIWNELQTLDPLKAGRSAAYEPAPVDPVPEDVFEATLPYMPPIVAAMARFQRLTGCRPSEVCLLRPCDILRPPAPEPADVVRLDGRPAPPAPLTWCYFPPSHKLEHHGIERRVYIGPRAQRVLLPFLDRPAEAFCFDPRESARQEREGDQAGQLTLFELAEFPLPKKHPRPGRRGKRYTRDSYRVAVVRAAAAADLAAHKRQPEVPQAQRIIPHWTPNQLRHSAADALERRFGKDAARAVLGHSDDDTTDIYLTRDFETAARIMAEVG